MNLSISSLNLVEIPRGCDSLIFSNVFEYCVKNLNRVPVGVYKRHTDDGPASQGGPDQTPMGAGGLNATPGGGRDFNNIGESKNAGAQDNYTHGSRKPYVWMHPPRNIELSVHDELFVLSDINPKAESGKGPPSDIRG